MALVKFKTFAIGAVAQNATGVVANTTTFDDSKPRRVTGLFCTNTTKGIQTQLQAAGRPFTLVDNSLFSATAGPLPVQGSLDAGVILEIDVLPISGALAAGDYVVIRYEVDS